MRFSDAKEEDRGLVALVKAFPDSHHRTLGIICKTPRQALRLHHHLEKHKITAHHLDSKSTAFARGVVVCCAHLAKGLEFDQVIVPHADDVHYRTEMDRSLLYVACTRAMHRLILTCAGEPSRWLPGAANRMHPN
jgi:DNA helicase-2/ATP-dependent DNA helicase PcrA